MLIKQRRALAHAYKGVRARTGRSRRSTRPVNDASTGPNSSSNEGQPDVPNEGEGDEGEKDGSSSGGRGRGRFTGPLFWFGFDRTLLVLLPCTITPVATTCSYVRFTKKGDRTLHRSRLEVCPAAASSIAALHKPDCSFAICALTGAFANLRHRHHCMIESVIS